MLRFVEIGTAFHDIGQRLFCQSCRAPMALLVLFADVYMDVCKNARADIFQKRQASIKCIVARLSCLGWTQEQIGQAVGKSQNRISEIIDNTGTGNIDNYFQSGKKVENIAEMLDLDIQTVWHYILEKKDKCLKFIKTSNRTYTVFGI